MQPPYQVGALPPDLDRSPFGCGTAALDDYFHRQVGQDIKRRVTACFVATDATGNVAGYYTLAAASVTLTALPAERARKLPRYPSVPAVRMGRLAVSTHHQGQGLGAALLADALHRSASADIAAYALLVDAKDGAAAKFYAHHGFLALAEQPLTLFLPLATLKGL